MYSVLYSYDILKLYSVNRRYCIGRQSMNRIDFGAKQCEPINARAEMCAGDKIFFDSVVRRAKLVMQDMFILSDRYKELIPSDTLGGIYSVTVLLEDIRDSLLLGSATCKEVVNR